MGARETVLEVKAMAVLGFRFPKAAGESLPAAVEDALRSSPGIRYVADLELGDASPEDGTLRVDAAMRLTFHLPPDRRAHPAEAASAALDGVGAVVDVRKFEVEQAYPVERY